jgi:hypothetical protein
VSRSWSNNCSHSLLTWTDPCPDWQHRQSAVSRLA